MNRAIQGMCFGMLACVATVVSIAAAKAPPTPGRKSEDPRALTIMDKHCLVLVRPFDVGDNVQTLGKILLEEEALGENSPIQNMAKKAGFGGVLGSVKNVFHRKEAKPNASTQPESGQAAVGQAVPSGAGAAQEGVAEGASGPGGSGHPDTSPGPAGQAASSVSGQTVPSVTQGGSGQPQAGASGPNSAEGNAATGNATKTAGKVLSAASGIASTLQSTGLAGRLPIPGLSLVTSAAGLLGRGSNSPQPGALPLPVNPQMAALQVATSAASPGQRPPTVPAGSISDRLRLELKNMNWLPQAVETEFGRRDHQSQLDDIVDRDSKEGRKLYPIADAMLQDILKGINEPTGYNFQLFILKSDDHNAIARPGGYVYVDAGLIKDPKLRGKFEFALGHEVGHILQRHETRELQSLIVDSFAVRKDISEAIAKMKNDPSSVLERINLNKNQYARYHKDQELEADSCSARLLAQAHGDLQLLANSLGAFISDLPPDDVAQSGVTGATPTVDAPLPAGAAGAGAPANTAPGARSSNSVQVVSSTVMVTEEIVTGPVNQHPSSKERKQNLDVMYQEVRTDLASGHGAERKPLASRG